MSNLFLVQRRTWYDEYRVYDDPDCMEHGGVPVAAFASKPAARQHARQLERQAREEASSPFRMMADEVFSDDLGLSEEQMCSAVEKVGLEPPSEIAGKYGKFRPWARWYDEVAETLTRTQRDGIWKMFAKIKVYEVVEVSLED